MKQKKLIDIGFELKDNKLIRVSKVTGLTKEYDVDFIEGLKVFDLQRLIVDIKKEIANEAIKVEILNNNLLNYTEDNGEFVAPRPKVIKEIVVPSKVMESNDVYHSYDGFISSTTLKQYKQSPAHARYYMDNKSAPTAAMIFGNAYHTMVLEPDLWEQEYFIIDYDQRPEYDKTMASSANKEWKQRLISRNIGKQAITKEEYNTMCAMRLVLFKNKSAAFMFTGGIVEQSHYLEIDGVKVKVRPDSRKKRMIIDLKTCEDASPNGFSKQCANFGYHISAALYCEAVNIMDGEYLPFVFVAQEKSEPYLVAIYEASLLFMEKGEIEMRELLALHKKCTEDNHWPGYEIESENERGILVIDLPGWYK